MRKKLCATLSLAWVLAGCDRPAEETVVDLPALNALPEFTVSGVSAGAYLAGQLHVAYSNEINGVGLVAGGPHLRSHIDNALAQIGARLPLRGDEQSNLHALLLARS